MVRYPYLLKKIESTNEKIVYLQMTAAILLIGSLFVASKIIVPYVPVFTALFLRQFLAFLVFLVLAGWLWYQKSSVPLVDRRDC